MRYSSPRKNNLLITLAGVFNMSKLILGGHWSAAPEGWRVFTEKEQDITQKLQFNDASVDVIFTEHVIEHVSMVEGIFFAQEAYRVLKVGGIFRVVAPMIDKMVTFQNDDLGKKYAQGQLRPFCQVEDNALKALGLPGVEVDPLAFLFDSLVRKHGHKFLWTTTLLAEVLKKIGFRAVNKTVPGSSMFDLTTAIERRIRGTHLENHAYMVYDPESGVVEAIK